MAGGSTRSRSCIRTRAAGACAQSWIFYTEHLSDERVVYVTKVYNSIENNDRNDEEREQEVRKN